MSNTCESRPDQAVKYGDRLQGWMVSLMRRRFFGLIRSVVGGDLEILARKHRPSRSWALSLLVHGRCDWHIPLFRLTFNQNTHIPAQ